MFTPCAGCAGCDPSGDGSNLRRLRGRGVASDVEAPGGPAEKQGETAGHAGPEQPRVPTGPCCHAPVSCPRAPRGPAGQPPMGLCWARLCWAVLCLRVTPVKSLCRARGLHSDQLRLKRPLWPSSRGLHAWAASLRFWPLLLVAHPWILWSRPLSAPPVGSMPISRGQPRTCQRQCPRHCVLAAADGPQGWARPWADTASGSHRCHASRACGAPARPRRASSHGCSALDATLRASPEGPGPQHAGRDCWPISGQRARAGVVQLCPREGFGRAGAQQGGCRVPPPHGVAAPRKARQATGLPWVLGMLGLGGAGAGGGAA